MEQDVITMQEIFQFHKSGIAPDGRVLGMFRATGVRPKCSEALTIVGCPLPMEMFEHRQQIGGDPSGWRVA
jgi:pilus assembly protein CpaF